MESQPQKFGKPVNVDPKTYAETGLLADEQDIAAERPVSLNNPAVGRKLHFPHFNLQQQFALSDFPE